MSANFWGGSAPQRREPLLPQSRQELGSDDHRGGGTAAGDDEKPTDPGRERDKIRCLDGLRGVACFLVFNYHFLWPWTPLIMLGYGARVPQSPEPFEEWASLPIICLLHRGRPMVAIFFAISGYVLCRHMLRAIHQRRLDDVYKRLASAVFRRVFRLYLPPTISMFIVALLAQMGAFRSEDAIYKGPDSVWINGTVTKGFFNNGNSSCSANGTVAVVGTAGVADALDLQSPLYLNSSIHWNDTLCLNSTSELYGAAAIYADANKPKAKPKPRRRVNGTSLFNETTQPPTQKTDTLHGLYTYLGYHADGSRYELPQYDVSDLGLNTSSNATAPRNFTWVQLGGMWEEHPHIHPNIFKALANFTVVYSEWANPFNFGHYHPRYDPHTYTIPMELRGSMVLYTFLLGTAALRARWRLGTAAGLSLYALTLGRWDMGTFLGGMVLSEVDVLRSSDPGEVAPDDRALLLSLGGAGTRGLHVLGDLSVRRSRALRWLVILVALWLLSYPDAGAEYTPGFRLLAWLAPRWYLPISKWMYYQSIGALLLIPSVLRSPTLRGMLEGSTAQYLGKVSFSFYLVHGPVLHSLGFWIMPRLFEWFGRPVGYIMGWFMLLSVTLWLVSWWHRKIDVWSVTVGRRVERALVHS
ncbi:hypothetical protein SLS53_007896 [Cytospora paraplurivora]|uniref:Acyltransferase 3 domain-containing protein n=1 Tax=Cytospora paraplurivora TaxID=2898453 RepID=A0AAN9YDA5_9PEZI